MKLRRRHIVLLVSLAVVAGTLWFLLRETSIVPQQVAHAFTENLLRQQGYVLQIDAIQGNPLGEMELRGVRVLSQDVGTEVARVRTVELRIDFWRLLRGRVAVHRLKLEEPWVRLGPGGLQWKSSPQSAPTPSSPLRLGRLEIAQGRVEADWESLPALRLDSLQARMDLDVGRNGLTLQLQRLQASVPSQALRLHDVSGRVRVLGDSLRLEEWHLATGRSQVDLHGVYGLRTKAAQLEGNANPFALADLDSLVALPVSGSVRGPFTLAWQDGALRFAGTWFGVYQEMRTEEVSVELSWSPEGLEIHRAQGRMGEGRFDLALEIRGEDVRGQAQLQGIDLRAWRQDLPASRLDGRLEFRQHSAEDTLHLRADLGPAQIAGARMRHLRGRADVLGSAARFPQIYLEADGGTVLASGRLTASREIAMDWELDASDVADFLVPIGLGALHGAARVQGSFHGAIDTLACLASGDFAGLRYGDLETGHGEIQLQAARLLPVPQVDLDVRGEQLVVGTRRLGRFTGLMHYDGVDLELRRAEVVAGDTLLAVAATVSSRPRDWEGAQKPTEFVALHTALLQIGGREFRVEEPAAIAWRDRAVRVDSLRLVTRGGRARVDLRLDLEASRIDTRTEIHDFDLGFLARLAQVQPEVSGSGSGWIELHGDLDATQADGRLLVQTGQWNALAFDSLRVELQSDAFGTAWRRTSLYSALGTVRSEGRLAYLPALGRWLRGATGSRAPEELAKAAVEARLELEDVALEPFTRALRGLQAPMNWGAKLSGRVELSGSMEAPYLVLQGEAQSVQWENTVDVDSLRFEADYAAGQLRLSQLDVEAAGAHLVARGRFPARLHLTRGFHLDREADMEAELQLQRSPFAVVPRFISLFELAPQGVPQGTVEANLNVHGSVAAPRLKGSLRVVDAGFTLENMEEVYRDVQAVGSFGEDTLVLSEIRGRSGRDGQLRGSGWVRFSGLKVSDYALSIDAQAIPVYSVPDIEGLVGGHLDIRAATLEGATEPVPDIRGSLVVQQAEITREFTAGAAQGAGLLESTDRPEFLADVTIEAPGRVWVRNSNVDAELFGSVEIIRTPAGLDVEGRAATKRGHYSAYLEKFEITRGDLDFSRHQGWEPELDIEARRGRLNERIYVHLTGTPSQPRLVFSSDAGGSADELQQILMADIRNDPANVATTVVENVFTDLGYLDSITIDPAESRTPVSEGQQAPLISAYNVSAGWAVSDRVFVTYTRGINQSDLNQRVALELDLLRGLLLASSWEIRYIPSPEFLSDSAQNVFNVDVKFRHEY